MGSQVDHHRIKIIEQCGVSPPHGSVPSSTSLPLTFFDLPWFFCYPVQRIFFYEFPHSIQHFYQTVLPNLKHSLSSTLQYFFPFAAKLVFPPKPHIPYILYSHGDSVSFTVAESTVADNYFSNLVADFPRDARDVYPLVPVLPSSHTLEDGTMLVPLMAIQVTVMSNSGFSICITFRHVAADGKAFHHFMKFWSSLCREILRTSRDLDSIQGPLPLHNRDIIEDPKGLKLIYLEELWNSSPESMNFTDKVNDDVLSDKIRFTCILSPDQIEKLKKWVSIQCMSKGFGTLHISTFVVTCSLMWVCKEKSEDISVNSTVSSGDELYHLAFLADCRNHSEFSIPSTYFGNCLFVRTVSLERSKLMGENGIVEAAIAIESKVRDFQSKASNGAETMMLESKELSRPGQHVVTIAGSPRLGVYETDFGWGQPKRSEILHISLSGSVSLSDCRGKEGGVEVGLPLGRNQLNNFNAILEEHLRSIEIRSTPVCLSPHRQWEPSQQISLIIG